MSVRFVRLQIAGFKSFCDSISLEILPGLTGIIGPNGCGKSNIVEAIRWVMGESSARSLRGGEMDDIIFSGTANRTSRNIAEVSLFLENTSSIPLTSLNNQDELQISRQIERGSSSNYRINGKSQRARDIQTLFADLGSGPRSSTIISQNRITQLISASPEERRQILEEAAGISGLHNRRREAELKLRATESNLQRLNDIRQQLFSQIETLASQAEQALLYRQVSASLRESETLLQNLLLQRAYHLIQLCESRVVKAKGQKEQTEKTIQDLGETLKIKEEQLVSTSHSQLQATSGYERWNSKALSAQEEITRNEQQLNLLNERISETKERQKFTEKRLLDAQSDLSRLHEQNATIQQDLVKLPKTISEIQRNIQSAKEQNTYLDQEIKTTEQILTQQKEESQQTELLYKQILFQQKNSLDELNKITEEHQQIQQLIPPEKELEEAKQRGNEAESELKQLQHNRQQIEKELIDVRLMESNAQYELKQNEEKHQSFQQQLSQQQTRLENIQLELQNNQQQHQQIHILLQNNQSKDKLVNQTEQTKKQLQQTQQKIEEYRNHYNQAVKYRLEQESLLAESQRLYKIRQENLLNSKNIFQQKEQHFHLLEKEIEEIRHALTDKDLLEQKQHKLLQIETHLHNVRQQLESINQQEQKIQQTEKSTQKTLNEHEAEIARQQARKEVLQEAIRQEDQENIVDLLPPIIESLIIPEGWEKVIGVIFGETLESPVRFDGPKGWADLPPISCQLPAGVKPLIEHLSPPPALKRIFQSVGLVENFTIGQKIFTQLHPGQCLVTFEGDLWRWDGYHQRGDFAGKTAQRLIERQNLRKIEESLQENIQQKSILEQQLQQIQETSKACAKNLAQIKERHDTYEETYKQCSYKVLELENTIQTTQKRFEIVQPIYQQAQEHFQEAQQAWEKAQLEAQYPIPSTAEMEQSRHQEETIKNDVKQTEIYLHQLEEQYFSLQQQQQQQIHEEQQNQTKLDSLDERIQRLIYEQQTLTSDIMQAKEQQAQLKAIQEFQNRLQQIQQTIGELTNHLTILQNEYHHTEQKTQQAYKVYQDLKERSIQLKGKSETLEARQTALSKALERITIQLRPLEDSYKSLPDLSILQNKLDNLINQQKQNQRKEEEYRLTEHVLLNDQEKLNKQKEELIKQTEEWQSRFQQTKEEMLISQKHLENLYQQSMVLNTNSETLKEKLKETDTKKEDAKVLLNQAKQAYFLVEQGTKHLREDLKQAEEQNIRAREALLKAIAKQEQAEALFKQLSANIDSADLLPFKQDQSIDISETAETQLRQNIQQFIEKRDELGAINLRAEEEYKAKQATLDQINKEYEDLEAAIQQLQTSIYNLNKQAREKLNNVFNTVDEQFRKFFTRMFNGGYARLKLLNKEDALQSGLEIYAQPPGKKLSTLSLLSGGEQALTALSLIFAVSYCNPVPICVLDEVDAPLDDPNVERFCNLLANIESQSGTRFLIITHHQLTMAHMHRLYGVTMQERGVSQIFSVDLERAIQIRESDN